MSYECSGQDTILGTFTTHLLVHMHQNICLCTLLILGNGPYFIILLCLTPDYFTMSNARRFYLSVGRVMPLNGLMVLDDMVLKLHAKLYCDLMKQKFCHLLFTLANINFE
jgi:hypothetical protein